MFISLLCSVSLKIFRLSVLEHTHVNSMIYLTDFSLGVIVSYFTYLVFVLELEIHLLRGLYNQKIMNANEFCCFLGRQLNWLWISLPRQRLFFSLLGWIYIILCSKDYVRYTNKAWYSSVCTECSGLLVRSLYSEGSEPQCLSALC